MDEKEVLRRLVKNDSLFRKIHIVTQKYDILPMDRDHFGAYIEYQDIHELRTDFLEELIDSIVDWIYSLEKFDELKKKAMDKGKSEAAASMEIGRKAKMKFRANHASKNLLIQGQLGELLLFHFIQRCLQAVPLLRKMKITTSSAHERFGADAIHYKVENGKNILVLGEAKTYTSESKFTTAFEEAIKSILNTYDNHRKEMTLYVHEDFLDTEMNQIAEAYINNTLEAVEVHLVAVVIYNEKEELVYNDENGIRAQIEKLIENSYKKFDNKKIKIDDNPILKRITYIIFPVWNLQELTESFQDMI